MAKKRSCRRTTREDQIHDKAVKLRKMTDEQLVYYVEDRVNKARSEGRNEVKQVISESPNRVKEFLDNFKQVPGIGKVTYLRLVDYAKENGYI